MANETENNSKVAVISAKVDPALKDAYTTWWKSKGFASEAEAVRYHIRQVTNFDLNGSTTQPARAGCDSINPGGLQARRDEDKRA